MKINVKNEKENIFLKRKELTLEIEHEKAATPSKAALQQLVHKQLGHSVDSVDIRNIFTNHGLTTSMSKVFVWKEKKVADLSIVKEEKAEKEAPKENK